MAEDNQDVKTESQQPDYQENTQWITPDRCIVQCTEVWPNKKEDGTYGAAVRKINTYPESLKADLEKGLADWRKKADEEQSGLADAEKKLASLGKKPAKTSEMIRLQENLRKLNVITQINQTEGKRDYHKSMLLLLNKQISAREASLAAAPKE